MVNDKELSIINGPAKFRFMSYMGDRQGCAHIRIMYPSLLLNLYRDKDNGYAFEADYTTSFINDPNFYKSYTFVQFQRSATDQHLRIFQHYIRNIRKLVKVPIIYEIDDLLQDIPAWNYASSFYNSNNGAIYKMMEIVDGMTVSTNKLKEIYSAYCNNIVVIPNHLPKFIWGDVRIDRHHRSISERPRIGWAGSENHFCNINSAEYKNGIRGGDFGDKILNFIKKTVDKYCWVFSGACPVELEDIKDKIEFHGWKSIFDYPAHLKSLDLDICVALLSPGIFNESKSNIKCLEYTVIGCPGVYSDIEPYKDMSCISNDEDGIINHIESLANDIDYRVATFENDYGKVHDQLFWEDNGYKNLKAYVSSYLSLFGKGIK